MNIHTNKTRMNTSLHEKKNTHTQNDTCTDTKTHAQNQMQAHIRTLANTTTRHTITHTQASTDRPVDTQTTNLDTRREIGGRTTSTQGRKQTQIH